MSDASDQLRKQSLQARRENRLDDARRDLIEAVDLCREAEDQVELARALADLGQIERDLHQGDAALKYYEEAVAIHRANGNLLGLAHTVRHVGDIHRDYRRAERAEPCYCEALNLYRNNEQTAPLDLANAIRGMALLKSDAEEIESAKLLWEEARDLYAAVNVETGVAESSRRLAALARSST